MAPTCSTKKVRLGDFRGWYDSGFAGIIWFPAPTLFSIKRTKKKWYYSFLFSSFDFACRNHRLGCKARGGSDARVRELMIIASKSKLQTLSASPPLHVFLQKRAFFRFCGRDPSKMTILAPSRKRVRIGLYRGVEKGSKSTFSGWSVLGISGFRRKLCASHLARPTPVVIAVEMFGLSRRQTFNRTICGGFSLNGLLSEADILHVVRMIFIKVMITPSWSKTIKKEAFEKNTIFAIFKIWIFFWLF